MLTEAYVKFNTNLTILKNVMIFQINGWNYPATHLQNKILNVSLIDEYKNCDCNIIKFEEEIPYDTLEN